MKPVPIPDELAIQGGQKHRIAGGNSGAADIEEAYITMTETGPVVSVLIECDEIDMRSLHLDNRFWLHFHGAPILPFSLDTAFVSGVANPDDPVTGFLQHVGRFLASIWTLHALGEKEAAETALDQMAKVTADVARLSRFGVTPDKLPEGVVSLGIGNLRVAGDVEVNGRKVGTMEVDLDDDEPDRAGPHKLGDGGGDSTG